MKFSFASLVSVAIILSGACATPIASEQELETRTLEAKKGLAYNALAATTPFAGSVGWAYDWDSTAQGSLPSGVSFYPMLWGTSSDHTSQWSANANAAISAGATHLLGFNEPDNAGQSNMTPAAAAAAWQQYIQPFAGRAKLISPAITNGYSTTAPLMGTPWMDAFIAACTGCTIDGIAMHIYDSATNIGYYESYIANMGTRYGKPVYVTEMGASGTTAQQQTFLQTMIPYLNGLSSVAAYAYFGDLAGILVDSNNNITPLGTTYKNT